METGLIRVIKHVLHKEMRFRGVTLLSYEIAYPEFVSARFRPCLARVNRFYLREALRWRHYCETRLFPMAVSQYLEDLKNGYPLRQFEAMQVFRVTDMRDCVLSLYFDRYEYTGGAHGSTVRSSQTWNLRQCKSISLWQLVQCPPNAKEYLLRQVEKQIARNPEIYFEVYPKLIGETFQENSFYCTPGGIVLYYQQYDIAPYSSGIREFRIPYGGCVKNPTALC